MKSGLKTMLTQLSSDDDLFKAATTVIHLRIDRSSNKAQEGEGEERQLERG